MKEIIKNLEKEVKKHFSTAKGSHDFDHTMRVFNLCIHIGEKTNADMEIILPAALLHDIGRKEEDKTNGQICHAEKGADMAEKILKEYGFSREKISKIVHCIKCHRFRGKNAPISQEAKVLFDADKLDSIGAVGIGRAFLFAGEIGAKLHNGDIDVLKTKEYSKEDTAYREFTVKLKHIKDRMLTKEGKKIAEERHKYMIEFFKRLELETKGNL